MDRRAFIAGFLGLLATPLAAEAQRPPEVRRIGYLQAGVSGLPGEFYEILREGLRGLGYVEGRNVAIE
jgi:putative tryptophan/tyrosine transport system substrate-binding protein